MPSWCDQGMTGYTDGYVLAGRCRKENQTWSQENRVPVSALSFVLMSKPEWTPKLIYIMKVWDKLIFKALPASSEPWLCHLGIASTNSIFWMLIKTKTRPHTLINNLYTPHVCLESHCQGIRGLLIFHISNAQTSWHHSGDKPSALGIHLSIRGDIQSKWWCSSLTWFLLSVSHILYVFKMSWGCPSCLHHLSSHSQEAEEPDISRTLRCINKSNDYKTFSSLSLIRRAPGTGQRENPKYFSAGGCTDEKWDDFSCE